MWTLKEIETEMKLGKCKDSLTYVQIYRRILENGIKPKITSSSDGVFMQWAITDEEYMRLFGI